MLISGWIPDEVRKSVSDLQKSLEECAASNAGKSDPRWKESVKIQVDIVCKKA